ncbi:hypothetical protein Q5H92_00110 [Hymenobacter sp. M29]|uniref:Uncharacterized protein n=1 Tax=Hymenobacter mellowenesis TaxID=3063995 RepID=A0ABT9A4H1_9BACT|nr:hypothetical protein [Hymenobacter sp. M29]MDO7844741.1 hypothetical protein [Hymenobacter sp. M29]
MLLGVYWYRYFPEGLYQFDFFTFRAGLGGHADGPAELTATVQAPDPAALLAEVRAVAARHPEVRLFGEVHGQFLRLTVGGYSLSDYAFFVAGELEKALRRQHAALATEPLPAGAQFIRLTTPAEDATQPLSGGLLQAVSSAPGRYGAETLSLRLDCHLLLAHKSAFITDLNQLCQAANLDVLYYLDYEIPPHVNLMLFFSNGRQGVGGQPLRYTNAHALAALVAACLAKHGGQPGHLGSYPDYYPENGPYVVRMADAAFALGT